MRLLEGLSRRYSQGVLTASQAILKVASFERTVMYRAVLVQTATVAFINIEIPRCVQKFLLKVFSLVVLRTVKLTVSFQSVHNTSQIGTCILVFEVKFLIGRLNLIAHKLELSIC